MKVLHLSMECFPAAKTGGLGDVVGALPKYLTQAGLETAVIIPKYRLKWLNEQHYTEVYQQVIRLGQQYIPFSIERVNNPSLGYSLYVANIPGKFDRNGIYADNQSGYGYGDETERYICFQQAVLKWVQFMPQKPSLLHCHDHHTALLPFMVRHCPEFKSLSAMPTILTIHNGVYQGAFSWNSLWKMPFFDASASGLLDWNGAINPLATGIKCAWRVTTVSPAYMHEMFDNSQGLEPLFKQEWAKCKGILNGIDTQIWNPITDPLIAHRYDNDDIAQYKAKNKQVLARHFNIQPDLPLITFIGRLVAEKGADLLPDLIRTFLYRGGRASFVVLGTGDPKLRDAFLQMKHHLVSYFDTAITYNETLAHQLYAGSDFLIMPSRVEPCGLNQMYAFRYGTVPIVRNIGGLHDTVVDIGTSGGGYGIRFNQFNLEDAFTALYRASHFYYDRRALQTTRQRIMALDHSWEKAAKNYFQLYREIAPSIS